MIDERIQQRAKLAALAFPAQLARASAANNFAQDGIAVAQMPNGRSIWVHGPKTIRSPARNRNFSVCPARAPEVLKWRVMPADYNYFNYFTEIEEYFWKKRGVHILVSPLDWAIVETWQKAGIPLQAVLKGIDRAFESWRRSRRGAAGRAMKSLAYCVDSVLEAATEEREAAAGKGPDDGAGRAPAETFSRDEVRAYLARNSERLAQAARKLTPGAPQIATRLQETAEKLKEILPLADTPGRFDLEDLERRLAVFEEKLTATLTANAGDETLLSIRREMDRALAAYRRKMTAEQLILLERQYTQKRLFETYDVPRLSLFYMA